jgi:site-specific DNA-methyltransferase (adenine-specific)
MGSYPYPRNGIIPFDYEYILLFKKQGKSPRIKSNLIKQQSKLSKKEWATLFKGHWGFGGKRQEKHKAQFPIELPKRIIKMYSFTGDKVFDPFLGSGTTMRASRDLLRSCIGIELNKSYLPLIKQKVGILQRRLSTNEIFNIERHN